MENEKLKSLLSKLEQQGTNEAAEFQNLSESFAMQLRGGYGDSNEGCSGNGSCNGNSGCSGNGSCNANEGCGGNPSCNANSACG